MFKNFDKHWISCALSHTISRLFGRLNVFLLNFRYFFHVEDDWTYHVLLSPIWLDIFCIFQVLNANFAYFRNFKDIFVIFRIFWLFWHILNIFNQIFCFLAVHKQKRQFKKIKVTNKNKWFFFQNFQKSNKI